MSEYSPLFRNFDESFASLLSEVSGAASGHAKGRAGADEKGGGSPRLDNVDAALTPDPEPEAKERGKEAVQVTRWRLKYTVSNLLRTEDGEKTPGVCKCGTAGHETPMVDLVRRESGPGISGVFFCDSPWLCPTCAPRRAAQRVEKVEEVFNAVESKGGRIVFVTLTVQHGREDSLADLKNLVMTACRKARQGKPWALAVERYGIAGTLVGPEVTWSKKHGWHFHLHLAVPMLIEDEATAEEGGEWLLERYRAYIAREGGRADRQAQDVTVVWRREDLADYLAKGSAAWEVASAGATKQGKKGLTPWDLAARAGRGDHQAAGLFREYAAAMPGTRSCVITKAMADKLGIAPHEDEDAPGVEEAKDGAEVVGSVEAPRWHRLLRRGYVPDVLKAVGDNWEWPAIDAMISRLLHEDVPVCQLVRRPQEHAPAAADLARQVLCEAHHFRGRKGQALQVVLDRERAVAKDKGRVFVAPDLRRVLELVAA